MPSERGKPKKSEDSLSCYTSSVGTPPKRDCVAV